LVLLEKLEEVLNFEGAILGHVSAVNGVSDSIESKLSSNSFRTQVSGDLRIVRSAKFTESGDGVLLTDLESDNGTSRHVFNDWEVLRKNTFVDIHKLLYDSAG